MTDDRISDKLKQLGFTAYEAKAYIALLRHNPATRYELSKNSGVPRSAIYDIIRKLETVGAANAIYTDPEKYIPLPPSQLFELLERQFQEKMHEAKQALRDFETQIEPGHLWNIAGYKNMIHKAREMVSRAERTIYISIWQSENQLLKKELDDAIKRGVEIIAFSFTRLEIISERIYSYNIPEKELQKVWDRKIILVIDKTELLMGEADNRHNKKTAWTDNKAIVDIATNHMILDITLFGLRNNIEVGPTVTSMESSGFQNLGNLLDKNVTKEFEAFSGLNGNRS
jgi:sugar-specific transcriptional regulator TrmB